MVCVTQPIQPPNPHLIYLLTLSYEPIRGHVEPVLPAQTRAWLQDVWQALCFYANEDNYQPSGGTESDPSGPHILYDNYGDRARAALSDHNR